MQEGINSMVAQTVGSLSKVELSWDEVTAGTYPLTPQQLFSQAVLSEAAKAKAALPALNGRIERARDLVLGGLVSPQPGYSFAVRSASSTGKTYAVTPDGCDCPDALKTPDGRCKHLLATWIWRRARTAVEGQGQGAPEASANGTTPQPAPEPTPEPTPEPMPALSIPAWALVELHGKQFITFGGLLAMAHERGLQSLAAHFVSVTDALAIAEATAIFADGRSFSEAADATPANVGAKVKAHCLRDALNISLVAVEELEG
jgi:hypothetical protein